MMVVNLKVLRQLTLNKIKLLEVSNPTLQNERKKAVKSAHKACGAGRRCSLVLRFFLEPIPNGDEEYRELRMSLQFHRRMPEDACIFTDTVTSWWLVDGQEWLRGENNY